MSVFARKESTHMTTSNLFLIQLYEKRAPVGESSHDNLPPTFGAPQASIILLRRYWLVSVTVSTLNNRLLKDKIANRDT
jgi:hypothetical protein